MNDAELIATKKIGIFPRTVTHEQAKQAARNLIDAHFNNKDGKGVLVSVPAQPDDDDILLVDYIVQQIERLETLTAENERLREALEQISNHRYDAGGAYEMCKIARAALQPQEKVG